MPIPRTRHYVDLDACLTTKVTNLEEYLLGEVVLVNPSKSKQKLLNFVRPLTRRYIEKFVTNKEKCLAPSIVFALEFGNVKKFIYRERCIGRASS